MAKPFPLLSHILHWTMAVLILAMLFIGIAMVSSRLFHPPPPLPDGMPGPLRFAAHASHWLLYVLMFALPLVGWAMLSAAAYPIVLAGSLHLPPILPHSNALYALLRTLHTALAFLLFATFLIHLSAALIHALIFRDGVFQSMTSWRR